MTIAAKPGVKLDIPDGAVLENKVENNGVYDFIPEDVIIGVLTVKTFSCAGNQWPWGPLEALIGFPEWNILPVVSDFVLEILNLLV